MSSLLKVNSIENPAAGGNGLALNSDGSTSIQSDIVDDVTPLYASLPYKLGAGITDFNTNSNGSYIMYDDGTLICWKNYDVTFAIGSGTGSIYYGGYPDLGNWPIAFIEKPTAYMSLLYRQSNFCWTVAEHYVSATAAGGIGLASSATRASTTYSYSSLGIGRWK
jgi:hypothetical protein